MRNASLAALSDCNAKIDRKKGRRTAKQSYKGGAILTALALVLDGSDGALLPPVHELRQRLDAVVAVPLPGGGGGGGVARAGAEVRGAELGVGEVGEAVHPEAVPARAGAGVVHVHEPEVVPERAEPAVVLAERVRRRLSVPRHPLVVHRPHLRLRPHHAAHLVAAGRLGGGRRRREAEDEDGQGQRDEAAADDARHGVSPETCDAEGRVDLARALNVRCVRNDLRCFALDWTCREGRCPAGFMGRAVKLWSDT